MSAFSKSSSSTVRLARVAAASWFCARSSAENHEPILTTLLHSWLIEEPHVIPFGSVVDAGAQKGRATCDFSKLAPSRTIFAVDPLRHNIASVNRSCGWRGNVRTLVGGLGATHTTLHVPWDKTRRAGQMISIASFTPGESPLGDSRDRVQAAHALENSRSGEAFEVHTVDELFETGAWQGERLGLGHWDTEGNELDVLRDAARTIARDRPLFTVELVVHKSPRYSAALLRFIAEGAADEIERLLAEPGGRRRPALVQGRASDGIEARSKRPPPLPMRLGLSKPTPALPMIPSVVLVMSAVGFATLALLVVYRRIPNGDVEQNESRSPSDEVEVPDEAVTTKLAEEAEALYSKGNTQFKKKEFKAALVSYRKALQMITALGPSGTCSVDAITVRAAIARVYGKRGKPERALEELTELLSLSRASPSPRRGPGGWRTAAILRDLGGVHATMNTLSGLYDGIELLKRGLAMMEEAGGAEKGAVVETLGLLATAYRELGKQGEALAWGERCLAEAEAAWGSDGPGAIEAASGLALTCKKAGDLDRAVRLMERCLAALEGGGDAEGAGRIARNLGKALAKGGARFADRRQELSRQYP
ncbi:hypothetical protein TeGR_g5211 [Tetraparma gracilis]|uniref:Methyltransferase FkbM domain-containing protein n=1 Tax=Tetraparma gracilis TaxID=2962635 RepID=A0ABQ6MHJ2_9STRA|nr:hypothetical protein TeGR_g5211 [Tetraparma gracilis]